MLLRFNAIQNACCSCFVVFLPLGRMTSTKGRQPIVLHLRPMHLPHGFNR